MLLILKNNGNAAGCRMSRGLIRLMSFVAAAAGPMPHGAISTRPRTSARMVVSPGFDRA